jgi:hypothetical protein
MAYATIRERVPAFLYWTDHLNYGCNKCFDNCNWPGNLYVVYMLARHEVKLSSGMPHDHFFIRVERLTSKLRGALAELKRERIRCIL